MMYRTVLLILYLVVLIPALTYLVRFRESPALRRLSAGLGVTGTLLCPTIAVYLCELLKSVFSVIIFVIIMIFGLIFLLRTLFR